MTDEGNPNEGWRIEQKYDIVDAARDERIRNSEHDHARYSDNPRPLREHWWQFWRKPEVH